MAKTKSGKIQRRKNFWGYLFIAPNFIGFIAFMLVPILMSLYFSFTDYDVITSANFVGLDNYISLFQDDQFITALLNTLWYCVLTVPAGVVLALLLDALRGHRILAAGLDTHNHEPLGAQSPFCQLDNVVLTDHTAYSTAEGVTELKTKAAQNVVDVLEGRTPRYPVNHL